MEAVKGIFFKYPQIGRPDKEILQFLDISLHNNDIQFFNSFYLQTWGTAMGKRFAPEYADIFLADWEHEVFKKCPHKPLIYLRYLDDIFIAWQHPLEDFHKFLQILNSHKQTIKPTISHHSVGVKVKGGKLKGRDMLT